MPAELEMMPRFVMFCKDCPRLLLLSSSLISSLAVDWYFGVAYLR